jgi:hypothetical protein
MQHEALREWLKRQPFQPFRVHLADGRIFDIRHPRTNLLAQTFIKIGIPEPNSTDPWSCDYTEYVPLAQITHVEPLSTTSPAKESGPDHSHPTMKARLDSESVRRGGKPVERDTLREWLKRQPFQPFRVHLADERAFDIRHPRTNVLAETFIKIGIPVPNSTNPLLCDHAEYVRLAQITYLEPLSTTSAAETSGKD